MHQASMSSSRSFVLVEYRQPGADPVVPLVAAQRHHELARLAGDQGGALFLREAESQPFLIGRDRGVDEPAGTELGAVPDEVLGGTRQRYRDPAHVLDGGHSASVLGFLAACVSLRGRIEPGDGTARTA